MHPMVPSIANLIHVGHVLLLLIGGAVAAESLQMVFAASELAIVDVEPCLDLARLRAATWKGVLGVQTSGRLHRHYALECRAIAAGLQRKYACSGPIVSIAEKVACLFDNPMTLSVLPKTAEHAPQGPAEQQPIGFICAGTRGLYRCASCADRRHHGNVTGAYMPSPAISV